MSGQAAVVVQRFPVVSSVPSSTHSRNVVVLLLPRPCFAVNVEAGQVSYLADTLWYEPSRCLPVIIQK